MDDVEAVGKDNELIPIYLANKINSCLINRSEKEKVKWCSSVFIACRHFIWRIFSTKRENKEDDDLIFLSQIDKNTMEAFGYNDCYDMDDVPSGDSNDTGSKKEKPSMEQIIAKRKNAIIDILNNDEDKQAFKEICYVIDDIVDYVGDLLLELCVNDYRLTFRAIRDILCNKTWLQKSEDINGAFKITTAEDSFFKNRANIFRALALGENKVYSSECSVIPNLLRNRKDGGDLWQLLTFKFFVKKAGFYDWKVSLHRNDIIDSIGQVFVQNEQCIKEFEESLNYLILKRILLRGKMQEQRDSVDLADIDLDTITYIYPSKAAKMLWDSLSERSILFEMFIDDCWIEREETVIQSKYKQFNWTNYNECIDYLDYLISVESEIRLVPKNRGTEDLYMDCFGEIPVTKQLFMGLKNSYKQYFKNTEDSDERSSQFKERLEQLEERIQDLSFEKQ